MTLHGELVATSDDAGRNTAYRVAYVQQQDVFYSQLTVRETLQTAAELRARARESRSPAERAAAVDDALRRLGLTKCADTRVGDAKTRGVSGGERKRLALACELVGDSPAVVCADEPTSGLDAFQAQRVMESLRDLARDERKTVVASIHQPRGSIVDLFDDVCLMAGGGRVVYCGPAEDAARWFAARGHPVPTACNPTEFLVDLVSVDASSPEAEEASTTRVDALVEAWARRERDDGASPRKETSSRGFSPPRSSPRRGKPPREKPRRARSRTRRRAMRRRLENRLVAARRDSSRSFPPRASLVAPGSSRRTHESRSPDDVAQQRVRVRVHLLAHGTRADEHPGSSRPVASVRHQRGDGGADEDAHRVHVREGHRRSRTRRRRVRHPPASPRNSWRNFPWAPSSRWRSAPSRTR